MRIRLVFTALCLGFLTAAGWVYSVGDDSDGAGAVLPSDSAQAKTDEPNPFEVPEGTPEELFRFINQVKRMTPAERTQEAIVAHVRKQVAAGLAAADAILEQDVGDEDTLRAYREKFLGLAVLARIDPAATKATEKLAAALKNDARPAIVLLARRELIQAYAQSGVTGTPEQRESLIEEVFSFLDDYGAERRFVGLAMAIGEALGRRSPESATRLLNRLGAEMEESEDPEIRAAAVLPLGTARRLDLPGNLLQLSGVTEDGSEFDWDSYRGRYVLVDFWATWCRPCVAEIPNVKRNLDLYEAKGFSVVGVNLDRSRADFDAFVDDRELPWQNIMPDADGNSGPASYYSISGIPTVILVDPEGKVISMNARGPELGRLLEQHLGPVTDGGEAEQD